MVLEPGEDKNLQYPELLSMTIFYGVLTSRSLNRLKAYSAENWGWEAAICPAPFSQNPYLHHCLVPKTKVAPTFTPQTSCFLFVSIRSSKSFLSFIPLYSEIEEVTINALQNPPGLLVSHSVALSANIRVDKTEKSVSFLWPLFLLLFSGVVTASARGKGDTVEHNYTSR